MALATHLKKIATSRKAYDKALASLKPQTLAKELGKLLPEGTALVWEQFIPGFNDGEPCTFRLREPRLVTELEVISDEPSRDRGDLPEEPDADEPLVTQLGSAERDFEAAEEGADDGVIDLVNGNTRNLEWAGIKKKEIEALRKAWVAIGESILESVFGSDVRVVVRDDGSHSVLDYSCGY